MAALLGAGQRHLTDFGINSFLTGGADWLGPLLVIAAGVMVVRVIWLLARDPCRARLMPLAFPTYLLLVGLQSIGTYAVFRCGVIEVGTLRYGLLGLFLPIGLTAAYFACEHGRVWRAAAVAVIMLTASVSVRDHAKLAREYMTGQPPNYRRAVADYLVAHGLGFARGGYWDASSVTFLSGERAIVASTDVVFIREYQWLVADHAEEAVSIEHKPCSGGHQVAKGVYVCPSLRP
jgi:hypothetical protein